MKLIISMLHPPTVQIITKSTVEELKIQIMSPFRNRVLRIIGLLRHETLKGKDVVKFKIQNSCENFPSLILSLGFYQGTPFFSTSQKQPAFPNSNPVWNVRQRIKLRMCYHHIIIYLFIVLIRCCRWSWRLATLWHWFLTFL